MVLLGSGVLEAAAVRRRGYVFEILPIGSAARAIGSDGQMFGAE